jgi:hypothetical protein
MYQLKGAGSLVLLRYKFMRICICLAVGLPQHGHRGKCPTMASQMHVGPGVMKIGSANAAFRDVSSLAI